MAGPPPLPSPAASAAPAPPPVEAPRPVDAPAEEDALAARIAALKACQEAGAAEGEAAAADAAPALSSSSLRGGNPVAAALEEARLITWPAPLDVVRTTGVVLGAVVVSTLLLLSANALLAAVSERLFG